MARWECCGREFDSEEALARHDVEVHGASRTPVGTCCGVAFYTREALEEHARGHGAARAESSGKS